MLGLNLISFFLFIQPLLANELFSKDSLNLTNGAEGDMNDHLVKYMLYTRKNHHKYDVIQPDNKSTLSKSHYDPNKIVKIVVHGWLKTYKSPMCLLFKHVFLKKYDANIILVDWSSESQKNYFASRLAISKVGQEIAHMVDTLIMYGTPASSIHILGHSLGAHVAGIAGLYVKSGNVSRVTGLDPAGPLFSEHDKNRIRPESAEFVDVIHSCGHVLGFFGQLGQADFYPNKGTYEQPGCGLDYKGKCSHGRSVHYYAESVNSNGFLSVKCPDWKAFTEGNCTEAPIPMGENAPRTARGKYYLKTNKHQPFAMGKVVY